MQEGSRQKMYRDKQNAEDQMSARSNPDIMNKNTFMISYDGFDVQEQLSIIQTDLKWMVDNFRRAQRSGNRKQQEEYYILQRKLGKTCKQYKSLFQKWSKSQIPNQIIQNQMYETEEDKSSRKKIQLQNNIRYWEKPIEDMVAELRKNDPSPQQLRERRRMKKQKQRQEGDDDLQSIGGDSDLSWEYDVQPGPLDQNSHLQNLIQYISEQLYLYLYLPSLLKITIVGINQIDQANERASLILKLQLKVRVPQNAQDDSYLYRHLSKLKIHVKSKKIKNQEENLASFLRKPGQSQQQSPLFYGNSIENDEDAPYSIWTEFKDYYTLNHKFKDKSNQDIKNMLKKLNQFDGVIYSAYLKDVQVKINTYAFNAPFEMLDLNGHITVQQIQTKVNQWQDDIYQYLNYDLSLSPRIIIKPNLINVGTDIQQIQHMVNAGPQIQIDDYQLAERLVKVELNDTNQQKIKLKNGLKGWRWVQKSQQQSQDNNPQILYPGDSVYHFHFPIYRHPFKALGGIYIPTVVLGIINCFIFFQDASENGLADRIANIATLLISFVAMITVIQAQIKKTVLTVTSILIHAMIVTPLLCMIQTMYLFFNSLQQKPLESFLFWICVFITACNFLYPCILYLVYRCIWEPGFNLDEIRQQSVILPGDKDLNEVNIVQKKNYMPIKSLRATSKIGLWQKTVSDFVKQTLADTLQSPAFKKKLYQIAKIYPKFHKYLRGQQGTVYQDILLSRSHYKAKANQI